MPSTTLKLQQETAMDLRALRVEMSRPGGAMVTMDEVLRRLISSWRESQDQVAVRPEAAGEPAMPGPEPVERPAPERAARRDAGPGKVPHRCPVKGWCEVCQEMKGGKR